MPNYIRLLLVSLVFALLVISLGYCTDPVDQAFAQLKLNLQNEGVSVQFIRTTENSVKRMISCDASIADIKSVLMDLWREGVSGISLKNAIASVAELVASGDNVLEAAKISSTAAHQAEAEGLGGFGVGMRVKKAVQARKAYLKTLNK